MATLETRPFSKNYSGLINQSVVALVLAVLCITTHDLMKRGRRGKGRNPKTREHGLGSVESWEFGYLYQGRCWAKNPSPPHPKGWPLCWVKSVVKFPEAKMNELRGVDATLYTRFLRGCWWFVLLHSFTTFPILFPIHVIFSDDDEPSKSMTRASISSLTQTSKGRSLLWIHVIVMFWVASTWITTLLWIIRGAVRLRAAKINAAATSKQKQANRGYHPHPHPQYCFRAAIDPTPQYKEENRGLRLRSIMVSNIPPQLRSEKELKEYFQYYLCRKIPKPAMGVTSSTQPGILNSFLSYIFNRVRKDLPYGHQNPILSPKSANVSEDGHGSGASGKQRLQGAIIIERVNVVRRMTELASLLERREEALQILETAHIKLAKRVVSAVSEAMAEQQPLEAARKSRSRTSTSRTSTALLNPVKFWKADVDVERGDEQDGVLAGEDRMDLLIRTISPFVNEFRAEQLRSGSWNTFLSTPFSHCANGDMGGTKEGAYPPYVPKTAEACNKDTLWDALLSLPRSALDPYQPLIHLSALFRGRTVPTIDYYTAKLNLLTSLITENRARAIVDYEPVSTAFVTFASPSDARKACKYLAVHPDNPLICTVSMAPSYEDVDWIRIMKLPFRVEFVKDWVIGIGVWGFTIFWLFPTSFLVGLVSIDNISLFWPGLKSYLDRHPWQLEVISSFLPTFLIAVLALLIPLILLLIAKKAQTISTLSALHDRILTRYYKFLVCNVLVFFCVGTATLQSFLVSFRSTGATLIEIISGSFPTAGPFYVGWLIFTTAIHGGFELGLFGLPLIMYPNTACQITPRKRAVGIRPRTFNFYYWLPNHIFVIHVLLLFATLNPLVIPFGLLYFSVEATIVKNSLLHVYAKNYEGNGHLLLVRIIRYSLDGLVLSQAVFLAYMVVNKYTVNVVLSAVLIVVTIFVKIGLTRWCRARYEADDIREANIVCGSQEICIDRCPELTVSNSKEPEEPDVTERNDLVARATKSHNFWTWNLPHRIKFAYSTIPNRPMGRRQPNPFNPPPALLEAASTPTPYPELVASRTLLSDSSFDVVGSPAYPDEDSSHTAKVIRQPPHPTWDDETHPDQPYNNPYYTLPIDNALWLPRNPCGLLDLDDTVNLMVSLTSEPVAGRLGAWVESSIASGLTAELESMSDSGDALSLSDQNRPLDGTEEIALSPGIASRILHIEREQDVDSTPTRQTSIFSRRGTINGRRPSNATTATRRPSVNGGNLSSIGLQHPATVGGRSPGYRSFSYGSRRTNTSGLPLSYVSNSDRRRNDRSRSLDEFGTDAPAAQRYLGSALSIGEQSPSFITSRSGRSPPPVSTHEAVISEVIAEERAVAENKILQAEVEVAKAKEPRSWLTSWMFAKFQ